MERESFSERYERLAAGTRLRQIERLLGDLQNGGGSTIALLRRLMPIVGDAVLDGDEPALELATDGLQRLESLLVTRDGDNGEALGRVRATIELSVWALTRIPSSALLAEFERDGQPVAVLELIAENPSSNNTTIGNELGIDPAQVSRIGRRLQHAGLVRIRRAGRTNVWTLTPRGLQATAMLGADGASRPQRPHRQLAR